MYVTVSTDTTSNHQGGVFSFSRGFSNNSNGSEAAIGSGTAGAGDAVQPLFDGDSDNTYYNSSNATGNLCVCGDAGGNPILYRVPISNGGFRAVQTGLTVANTVTGSSTICSPVTEIYNSNTANGPFDWIFLSVEGGGVTSSCNSGGCVMNFIVTTWQSSTAYAVGEEVLNTNLNIQKVTTAGTSGSSQPTWTTSTTQDDTVTWTYQGAMAINTSDVDQGGTSGIIIDNASASAGASQVYFSTLGNTSCSTSGGTGRCAIQASQSGLTQ